MQTGELRGAIEQMSESESTKAVLSALLAHIESLQARLAAVSEKESAGNPEVKAALVASKLERLDQIKHGLTELTERMQRPYVISAELQAVKEVLDVLAESGECNSVILEGEPGTGKTQWAYSEVGQLLQEGRKDVSLVHVRVKETMTSQDLLYRIDDTRRLSDAQAKAEVPDSVRAEAGIWKQRILKGEINPATDEDYKEFKTKMNAVVELGETGKDLDYANYVDLGPLGEAIHQSSKGNTVYLIIDEIEKGREELMTGMLDEIENLTFTIAETGQIIKGDKSKLRIIITTNTEDSDKIPDSFRRRSLYHFIDYPGRGDMATIVNLNFPGLQEELLNYALSVFYQFHNNKDIRKKPSTPELLAWIRVLSQEYNGTIPQDVPHREILLKFKEDQDLNIGGLDLKAGEETELGEGKLPHYVERAAEGAEVYHLFDNLNSSEDQSRFGSFYATLESNGVHFNTPVFEDSDNYYNKKCFKPFQVIVPGVESLGDGYYVIPTDKFHLFAEAMDFALECAPANSSFVSVDQKNSEFMAGKVQIGEDFEVVYEGFKTKEGVVVIKTPIQH